MRRRSRRLRDGLASRLLRASSVSPKQKCRRALSGARRRVCGNDYAPVLPGRFASSQFLGFSEYARKSVALQVACEIFQMKSRKKYSVTLRGVKRLKKLKVG